MKRSFLGVCLALLGAVALGAAQANAAPTVHSEAVSVSSGPEGVAEFTIVGLEPISVTFFNIDVVATATWSGSITTNLGWDTSDVRQGKDVDISRSAPLTGGAMDVEWELSGTVQPFNGLFGTFPIGEKVVADDVACNPKFAGGSYICSVHTAAAKLFPTAPTTPYVKLAFDATFEVTPEGALVSRTVAIGGTDVAGPDDVSLITAPQIETFAMPCTGQAGDSVDYALESYSWSPPTEAKHQSTFEIGMMDASGLVELPGISVLFGAPILSTPQFDLTGSGLVTELGALLQNNAYPTIDPLGPFSGNEGSQISFSADVDSGCPIASYIWEFSDGTTSYGPAPKRAFADNGDYDGQLTITDATGLTATKSFTVDVANLAPVVNAGPDTTADWGRLVQFNGQATDPGSADQATLQYMWSFGDGTPSAAGGPSVVHAYSTPGTYTAQFVACDKDASCKAGTRDVIVTKRETTLGYTGPLKAGPSKVVTLKAHLVDEYGQPVSPKKITFVLGTQTAVGTTDASGNASASVKLNQKPGGYSLSATFPAGDAKYKESADSGLTFVIGK